MTRILIVLLLVACGGEARPGEAPVDAAEPALLDAGPVEDAAADDVPVPDDTTSPLPDDPDATDAPDAPAPTDLAPPPPDAADVAPPPPPAPPCDGDGDGATTPACGGDDCDDTNPGVHPGAADLPASSCTAEGLWDVAIAGEHASSSAALALGPKGEARLAFQTEEGHLALATDGAAGWETEVVDLADGVGSNLSIAVDALGHTHLAYLDLPLQGLRYATDGPGYFALIKLNSGFAGWFTSIAAGKDGRVHLAYQDVDEKDLLYATCPGDCATTGDWAFAAVDTQGAVGRFTSMALDAKGDPHVAYEDSTNGHLKVVTLANNGVWSFAVADAGPGAGGLASLALDAAGHGHAVSLAAAEGAIRYASDRSGTWVAKVAVLGDYAAYTGQRLSIVTDASGWPHMAYADGSGVGLRYLACTAMCEDGCCAFEPVVIDPGVVLGQAVSMAADALGQVRIGYTDGDFPHAAVRLAAAPCAGSAQDVDCDGSE